MKISTKTGDAGKTKLMFGRDVFKCDQRVCAYGALDDFSATLGLARSFAGEDLSTFIKNIQQKLVFLMTELATSNEDFNKLEEKNLRLIGDGDLEEIENKIDSIERDSTIFDGWTYSGETHLHAALEMSRARCRAAEREIVRLNMQTPLPRKMPLVYINRLSDLLWLLAQQSIKDKF